MLSALDEDGTIQLPHQFSISYNRGINIQPVVLITGKILLPQIRRLKN
jgi:hypothetical protein